MDTSDRESVAKLSQAVAEWARGFLGYLPGVTIVPFDGEFAFELSTHQPLHGRQRDRAKTEFSGVKIIWKAGRSPQPRVLVGGLYGGKTGLAN